MWASVAACPRAVARVQAAGEGEGGEPSPLPPGAALPELGVGGACGCQNQPWDDKWSRRQ